MDERYAVNGDDLHAIAEAIRAKSGTGDKLVFPDGFAEAIAAIASGGAAGGLAYDMGEWSVSEDKTTVSAITFPHNLGDVPDFVCVWTDSWAGITDAPYSSGTTMAGWIWMRGMTGMTQRASSTANVKQPMYFCMTISANDYRISGSIPSSASYGIRDSELPTSEVVYTPTNGASSWWRAGMTYKYFVSKAWWTVGGGAVA